MHSVVYRHSKQGARPDASNPSSHTNLRYLTAPQMVERIQKLHKCARLNQQKAERLKKRIESLVDVNGVVLDDVMHQDLTEVAKESTPHIEETYPPDSFARLFWEQQTKACAMKVRLCESDCEYFSVF